MTRLWPGLLFLLLAACSAAPAPQPPKSARQTIGLFTTLPLIWGEGESLAASLDQQNRPHWVRNALEARGTLVAIDRIERAQGSLDGIDLLILAQPRALSPEENVALDAWVRDGGAAVMFLDPLLTWQSGYPLGDLRRPMDMVRLGPLLAHWGLALERDERVSPGERLVPLDGQPWPVNLPGLLRTKGEPAGCSIANAGLTARCRIGKGKALIIADAAILEPADETVAAARTQRLATLLDVAGS